MYVEQIYTNCLAEASYYIESNGEAAIIDPVREPDTYLALAASRKATIKYVFETHFHADFVSGHLDLAKATGAMIVFGPTAKPAYEAYIGADNESFRLGGVEIVLLHTPGHTPESSTFLLRDESGANHAIFTGDTLFIGDVGRPDLLDAIISKEELGGMLYDSLHQKLMPLSDEVIVYPGHGPGSACGKQIGKETVSTMGVQKATNYALQPMSKTEFIETVLKGQPVAPAYFLMDVRMNKQGYDTMDVVMARNLNALPAATFKAKTQEQGAFLLDTRTQNDFARGFVPGSVNIGLDGSYALWVGAVVPTDATLLLITDEGREQEAILRLARVGYENVAGFLEGGVAGWVAAGESLAQLPEVTPEAFAGLYADQKTAPVSVFDVRKSGEFADGHVQAAEHLCLSKLDQQMDRIPKDQTTYLYCQGGYRSTIAVSWLMAKGWQNLINVAGGYAAISQTDAPLALPQEVLA
ncbi:MAG: rhodanese-like domain-containing protein [Bernardetiaceae bacterium]